MRTQLISEDVVSELISPRDAVEAVRDAHIALASGNVSNVVRSRARSPQFTLHSMSAVDRSRNYAAIKVYSSIGAMIASHVLLYRMSNGELLTMIEAKELGRLRTAAAAVVAILAMNPAPIQSIGLIGAGYQAEGIVKTISALQPEVGLNSVNIATRTSDRLQQFIDGCRKHSSIQLMPCLTTEELCNKSEVVITATTASSPVIEAEWIDGVRHITAVGANSLIRRELAPKVITHASQIVVDDIEVAKAEGGNLLQLIETGRLAWNQVETLGDILRQRVEPQAGLTIFCSHGLAIQDLYLAALVYERFIGRGKQ